MVFPRNEPAASEIVSATSAKFSGAAEIDVLEIVFGVNKAVDDDGTVKADAAENKVAVTVKAASDFIVIATWCV